MTNKLLYSIAILLLIVIVAMLIVRTDAHTFLGRVGASVMIILAWDIIKTQWKRFNE